MNAAELQMHVGSTIAVCLMGQVPPEEISNVTACVWGVVQAYLEEPHRELG